MLPETCGLWPWTAERLRRERSSQGLPAVHAREILYTGTNGVLGMSSRKLYKCEHGNQVQSLPSRQAPGNNGRSQLPTLRSRSSICSRPAILPALWCWKVLRVEGMCGVPDGSLSCRRPDFRQTEERQKTKDCQRARPNEGREAIRATQRAR